MITLMDRQHNNIFSHKIILVTDRNGHALYYPTVLPTQNDEEDNFYNETPYFYQDGIPRYLYYVKVDYLGTENYAPFSKEFRIYIEKQKKITVDSNGGS